MSRRVSVVLLVLLVLAALVVGAYLYGRNQCLPPEWWLRVFDRANEFGCLRVIE